MMIVSISNALTPASIVVSASHVEPEDAGMPEVAMMCQTHTAALVTTAHATTDTIDTIVITGKQVAQLKESGVDGAVVCLPCPGSDRRPLAHTQSTLGPADTLTVELHKNKHSKNIPAP